MPTSPRRSDALANRERIVASARTLLAESNGAVAELKLHLVAKAAGVGQGTLYRNFPTREHLAAAVYSHEMDELVDDVPRLARAHPPLEALSCWLDRVIEYTRVKRGVMAAIEAASWRTLYADHHDRLDAALTALLDQGRAAGQIRDDVDATDIVLLLGALARIPAPDFDARARSVVNVVIDGLRRRES